jgi:hypothetical protein
LHEELSQSVASTRQSSLEPPALASPSSSSTFYGDWLGKEGKLSSFMGHSTFSMMGMVVFSGLLAVTCLLMLMICIGMIHCGAYFDAKFKNKSDLIHLPMELSSFIVSTSPCREMAHDFRKPPAPQVSYMPIWTNAELETIAPLFPEANSKWHKCFRPRWNPLTCIRRHNKDRNSNT